MKPKFRNILEMALEEGVRYGWNRAHKHNPNPDIDAATNAMVPAIMDTFEEWFDFDGDA
jgi:hypothetical protein